LAYSFHGEGLLIDGFATTILSGFLRLFYPFRGFGTGSYVIDNKSPDSSLEKSKQLAKNVLFETIFIENDDNYGVAKGNNQGIEAALNDDCTYILLSNNDIILRSDTIEKLYLGLKRTKADMAVPKIYYYKTNKIWFAGGKFIRIMGSIKHCGQGKEDQGQYNRNYRTDYASTCFMLMKNDVFLDVGLMDERYFVYYDDTDFLYRAFLKRKVLYYIYNSIVEHKVSISTGDNSDFSLYYNFHNRIYYVKKNFNVLLYLIYFINILYHYSIRNIKMAKNRRGWKIIKKALYDGLTYANAITKN
jgi:GT2 family glycosyltransferase